jgi:hypothetical protein
MFRLIDGAAHFYIGYAYHYVPVIHHGLRALFG